MIDEYRLVIHPVVLGAGERLFTAPLTIEPISTTAFSGGAVARLRRAPVIEPGPQRVPDAATLRARIVEHGTIVARGVSPR